MGCGGGSGGGGDLRAGRTVGLEEERTDRHVRVANVPASVIDLLERVARVLRSGSVSSAQHAQASDVHLYTTIRVILMN